MTVPQFSSRYKPTYQADVGGLMESATNAQILPKQQKLKQILDQQKQEREYALDQQKQEREYALWQQKQGFEDTQTRNLKTFEHELTKGDVPFQYRPENIPIVAEAEAAKEDARYRAVPHPAPQRNIDPNSEEGIQASIREKKLLQENGLLGTEPRTAKPIQWGPLNNLIETDPQITAMNLEYGRIKGLIDAKDKDEYYKTGEFQQKLNDLQTSINNRRNELTFQAQTDPEGFMQSYGQSNKVSNYAAPQQQPAETPQYVPMSRENQAAPQQEQEQEPNDDAILSLVDMAGKWYESQPGFDPNTTETWAEIDKRAQAGDSTDFKNVIMEFKKEKGL